MSPSKAHPSDPPATAGSDRAPVSGSNKLFHNALVSVVPTLAVPVAFALLLLALGGSVQWLAVGAGAAGWLLALVVRTPVILLAQRFAGSPSRAEPWVVGASGPAEELVRVAAVLLLGRAFPLAYSIGFGWAAIEVLYSLVTSFALASLAGRTDEQATQARAVLETQGRAYMLSEAAPLWGIVERVSASALHIGFTLLLAWQPWLALLTIPAHSGTNYLSGPLARRSVALVELVLALIGAAAFLAGLAAFGHIG